MKEIISFDVYIDEEEMTGVDRISLVKRPAIMTDFVYMADEQAEQYKQVHLSDDKQIIVGPALIPDLEIVRKDEDGEPYFIKYSKEQIERIAQKFFKFKNSKSVNKEHKENQAEDTYIYESWIVGENDKAASLGFDVPVGTWMVSMKVENDELWQQIKSGKYRGFSIEGLFKFKRSSRVVKQCGCGYGDNETEFQLESYTDYPEGAKSNAKKALEWAEKNGWGDCGTAVGKARANQLANGEPISEETIARMAAFKRHEQNKDVPYSEGCGGLMYDAWGGDAGISWAQNKLKEIRQNKIEMAGQPGLVHPNCRCSIRRNEFRLSKPRLGKNGQPVPCEVCKQAKVQWDNQGFFEDVFEVRYEKTQQSEQIELGYLGEGVEYYTQQEIEKEKNVFDYNIVMSEQISLVKPGASETQDEFISRCMGDDKMNSEFPEQEQRAAVCYAYWDEKQEKIKVNMVSAILKDGNTLHTDAESMAVGVEVYFLDGETKVPVENGEYELEDGNIISIEDSKIKEIKEMNMTEQGDYKEGDKKEEKMALDPMIQEQFDALKGMLENLNLKIDALMGAEVEDMKSVKQSLETLETKVEKIAVEKEMKSVETIDDIKKVAQTAVRKKIDYDVIAKYNKKF